MPRTAAAALSTTGLHIRQFNPSWEDWCEYAEHQSHYYVENDIVSEDKKRAILPTVLGPETYRLLKLLVSLRKLKELQFTELVDLATKPFNPQAIPIIKRFDVNSNSQKEGELIGVYLAELYIK